MNQITTLSLLFFSNLFMTFAWYGHLKFKSLPLWIVILASWGIAFFEYCLQVPANRYGSNFMSVSQLKAIQEFFSLSVFIGFSYFYLKEQITWHVIIGFALIFIGAVLIMKPWN